MPRLWWSNLADPSTRQDRQRLALRLSGGTGARLAPRPRRLANGADEPDPTVESGCLRQPSHRLTQPLSGIGPVAERSPTRTDNSERRLSGAYLRLILTDLDS